MPKAIRLILSVDHQNKKTRALDLPFSLYLHFVTSTAFEEVMPEDMQTKCYTLKKQFFVENKFFSDEYKDDYIRNPYVRFLTGPDVHKSFAKILSLNYQTHKQILQLEAGSFLEYFSDFDLFWNEKYQVNLENGQEDDLRAALFCQACLNTHHGRVREKKNLRARLGEFAKNELAEKEAEIARLKRELVAKEQEIEKLSAKVSGLRDEIREVEEKNLVLVPSDPHYMLGLQPGSQDVETRAKVLMKAIHPDRSGSQDTAYLFDMILKARDMIVKG